MILASFDLSFFTSIPGMLITGGVLLLLIALIIFIATGSKKDGKKNKKEKDSDVSSDTNASLDSMSATTMDVPNANIGDTAQVNNAVVDTVSSAPTVEPTVVSPEVNNNSVNVGEVQPSVEVNTNQSTMPTVDMPTNDVVTSSVTPNPIPVVGASNTTVNDVVTPMGVNDTNNVNMNNNIDTATLSDVASAPAVTIVDDSNSNNDIPIVEVAPKEVSEEPKSIYGGSNPVIPKIEIDNNAHRPIYGGANPLENTQSIPTINNMTSASTVTPNNDVKVDIPTVTATPNMVSPSEVVTNASNNTVVGSSTVDIPIKDDAVASVSSTPINNVSSSNPKKEEEIESLF